MNYIDNKNLPKEIKRLKKQPSKLYYNGKIELLNMQKVSIVGSRKASVYTKECIKTLCLSLQKAQVCVVSGGALGVDITAHKYSMPYTIGVFASGLDIIYPKSNSKIIEEIYNNGLALSEYEYGSKIAGYKFLERNRIVVALSRALVIAQADEKSGSMQSARIALELGIPIYVLAQKYGQSDGTNKLLSQGKATLINNFDDFANSFSKNKIEASSTQKDYILSFCKDGVPLDEALNKFGNKIYEYEFLEKIEISNLLVKSK